MFVDDSLWVLGVLDSDHVSAEEVIEKACFAVSGESDYHTYILFEVLDLSIADLED